jgi:hypothetical protein
LYGSNARAPLRKERKLQLTNDFYPKLYISTYAYDALEWLRQSAAGIDVLDLLGFVLDSRWIQLFGFRVPVDPTFFLPDGPTDGRMHGQLIFKVG